MSTSDDRPVRPTSAPTTPPPSGPAPGAPRSPTTQPVGVRDGDVVIVGCDTERMDMASLHGLRSELRLALGDVNPIFVAGHPGVTVLRPERAA